MVSAIKNVKRGSETVDGVKKNDGKRQEIYVSSSNNTMALFLPLFTILVSIYVQLLKHAKRLGA